MRTSLFRAIITSCIATTVLCSPALAQTASATPEQQVRQHLSNFQDTVTQAEQSGAITAKQATTDKKKIADIQARITKSKAKHRGVITLIAQSSLNSSLDKAEATEKSQEAKTAASKNKKHK